MASEFTPFLIEARQLVNDYSSGTSSLMETTVAVNAVRSWDSERARTLEVTFLQSIRARAISVLTESSITTPLQRELTSRALLSIEGMAGGVKPFKDIDKVDKLGFWIPEITEGVTAMSDLDFVQYTLSLRGKAPRPQDSELENIAHPSIFLSDRNKNGERSVGLIFTQGTHTHGTLEGIILSTTRTEEPDYYRTIRVPEEAPTRLHDDLDAFLLKVETSPLYCRALGAFSLIQ